MKNTAFGVGAVMVSNSCFLGNSFIIKHNPLTAGEIMITRSLLQLVIFGAASIHKRKQATSHFNLTGFPFLFTFALIFDCLLRMMTRRPAPRKGPYVVI